MAQELINAQHQVNLATLPAFSNDVKEDKYTAAQWLQKVLLHRRAAAWNDEQIITHFRNALKNNVIDWFDSLPALGVSQLVWQEVQERFEIDYKAKATATSIVAKIPEIKQGPDESVNDYFSRANKILWELKSNVDVNIINIPAAVLPEEGAAAWVELGQEVQNLVVNHVRTHAAASALEQYNAMFLIAGFKPAIKTKIMSADIRGLADIKNLALKTEALEMEKKAKASNNGFPINPIDEEEDIDALRFNNQRGGYHSRGNFRGGYQTQNRGGGNRGNFRGGYSRGGGQQSSYQQPQQNQQQNQSTPHRGGHVSQRGGNTQNNQNGQNQNSGKWCANCRKPTHNTAQCWTKKKVNPVEEDENHQDQENFSQQDEREYEEAVHTVFNSKN